MDRKLPFAKENYLLFISGIVTLIAGYYFMTIGSWDSLASLYISPVLLIIAYCVLLPLAIMKKFKKNEKKVK